MSILFSTGCPNQADHSIDVAGFHGVYWTIFGCAVAALLISFAIKSHSMDKILQSKFVLQGGKGHAQNPIMDATAVAVTPARTAPAAGANPTAVPAGSESFSESEEKSGGNTSTTGSDVDSTCSETKEQAVEDAQAEKGADDEEEGETRSLRSIERATEGVTSSVAYYVEAQGISIPVHFLEDESRADAKQDAKENVEQKSQTTQDVSKETAHELEGDRPDDEGLTLEPQEVKGDTPKEDEREEPQVTEDPVQDKAEPEDQDAKAVGPQAGPGEPELQAADTDSSDSGPEPKADEDNSVESNTVVERNDATISAPKAEPVKEETDEAVIQVNKPEEQVEEGKKDSQVEDDSASVYDDAKQSPGANL